MSIARESSTIDHSVREYSEFRFQHRTLNPEKREIRLCRFANPADAPEKLNASLETFALGNTPPYIALSYEWGETTENIPVHISGATLSIRRNLADFISTLLRLDLHNTFFWTDQICIDQESTTERNHQVRLMSEIYSNAEEVIAWIGMALPNPRRRHLQPKEKRKLMRSSYWRRLWIAQEFLLARKVRVCGFSGIVAWEQITSWALPRTHLRPSALAATLGEEFWWAESGLGFKFWNYVLLRDIHSDALPLPLVQAINKFSECECSDPKDKVYGLLGLVKPEEKIEVDYNITPRSLMYRALMKVLVINAESAQTPEKIIRPVFGLLALRIGLRRAEWRRIDQFMAKYKSIEHRTIQPQNLVRSVRRRDRRRIQ